MTEEIKKIIKKTEPPTRTQEEIDAWWKKLDWRGIYIKDPAERRRRLIESGSDISEE